MKTCFFIGHRDAPDTVKEELADEVERHIAEYGVTEFVVGGYGKFDAMAESAVLDAKKRCPKVALHRLLPYYRHDRPVELPEGYDGTFYPPDMEKVPKRVAIVRANHYMVDHSDFLIAYVRHFGNTRDLVEYAEKREARGLLRITKLSIPD